MGHVVGPQYLCPTMVDPRFRHGPLGQSVHVTKAAHTFVETNCDGESRWKNVGMPHNVEGAGGEVGKGVNDERTGQRTKEEKKEIFIRSRLNVHVTLIYISWDEMQSVYRGIHT